ncbi:hypothetical protein APSETT445_007096 [Aspergillus pseudonomiae]
MRLSGQVYEWVQYFYGSPYPTSVLCVLGLIKATGEINMKGSFLLLHALVAAVGSIPTRTDYVLHERRDAIPSHWTGEKRLDGQTMLPMRIGLTQSNLDRGHDLLMEVSTPGSHQYGDHLTVDEVHDLFAPSQDSVDSVRSWLESAGIAPDRITQSTNKQWLQFDAGADEVEQLLKTEFYRYSHAGTGRSHVACREYHVPESVQSHIDYITPGIKHLEIREERPAEKRSVDKRSFGILPPILRPLTLPLEELLGQLLFLCDVAVTPACIQEQATTSFPSGGGFSNIYQRPDYQNAAVEEYFNTAQLSYPYYESVDNSSFAANGGIYNRIGRAYPDVAAIADNVLVFNKGLPTLVGGTSAAAPVFAALLTRINEERLAAGKKTVGFVNPVFVRGN